MGGVRVARAAGFKGVCHLEVAHLAQAPPARIGRGLQEAVPGMRRRREQPADLGTAEDRRQPLRLAGRRDVEGGPLAPEGDVVGGAQLEGWPAW